jgi:molecular chaperone DnaK
VLSSIEAAIAEVRTAGQGDDLPAIKKATDALQHASHAVAELLYKTAQTTGSSAASATPDNVKHGEVVDAEYAET